MAKLAMCRVCLSADNLLHSLTSTHLKEIYDILTMKPLETKDSKPIHACYICCAELERCYQLRKNCLESEELYNQMLSNNLLTPDKIRKSRRRTLKVDHVVRLSLGIPSCLSSVSCSRVIPENTDGDKDSETTEMLYPVKIEPEDTEGVSEENITNLDDIVIEVIKEEILEDIDTAIDNLLEEHGMDEVAYLPHRGEEIAIKLEPGDIVTKRSPVKKIKSENKQRQINRSQPRPCTEQLPHGTESSDTKRSNNDRKKERQQRYREQNREKLKQREMERRLKQRIQAITASSMSSHTSGIEFINFREDTDASCQSLTGSEGQTNKQEEIEAREKRALQKKRERQRRYRELHREELKLRVADWRRRQRAGATVAS